MQWTFCFHCSTLTLVIKLKKKKKPAENLYDVKADISVIQQHLFIFYCSLNFCYKTKGKPKETACLLLISDDILFFKETRCAVKPVLSPPPMSKCKSIRGRHRRWSHTVTGDQEVEPHGVVFLGDVLWREATQVEFPRALREEDVERSTVSR